MNLERPSRRTRLIIGLNNPDKRSRRDDAARVASAFGELDTDADLRAGVLYGEGAMFTAGLTRRDGR
jgi:enoyl-CoA hydratase/carnithine racemase